MEHISTAKAYMELMKRKDREDVIDSYNSKLETLETYLTKQYKKLEVYFKDYTKHDWGHTIKVLDYMYDLVDMPEQLSEEEIMVMIFVALLHDIGMACDKDDVKELIHSCPMEEEAVRKIIRAKHGEFAEAKIRELTASTVSESLKKMKDVFMLCYSNSSREFDDVSIMVAHICNSHTKPIHWIQNKYKENPIAIYFASLLRLADLLDVDGNRTEEFFQSSNNDSAIHNLFNQIIADSNKIKKPDGACQVDCPNRIANKPCSRCYKRIELAVSIPYMTEDSKKAYLRHMIRDYKDDIEVEIFNISKLLDNMDERFRVKVFPYVNCKENKLQPSDFPKIDTHRLKIDYSAIKSILFEDQLYANKWCGVREILQNAYDACKAFAESKNDEMDWEAKISIVYDPSKNTLTIRDNGIGMTEFVIKEYFLNFGKSIYNFDPAYLYDNYHSDHIGHFGIGFFASFLLSSKVTVKTQSSKCALSTIIELDKDSNFATLTYNRPTMGHGTEIILDFEEVKSALMMEDIDMLMQYIKDCFLFDKIHILYAVDENRNFQEYPLQSFPVKKGDTISEFLSSIDANVIISTKEFPAIFYAVDQNSLLRVEYDELLIKLAEYGKKNRKQPFLDAGSFWIFPGCDEIENDFSEWARKYNPRRNYSMKTHLSDSIPIEIGKFCEENKLDRPKHCEYIFLDFVVEGNSAALTDTDIICASLKNIMRYNDACGEAQRDDKIYLRDVRLPSLHICLPKLNFRYNFDWLIANIKTDNIFPTVMRDSLTDEKSKELSYAIGYAVAQLRIKEGVDVAENKLITDNFYDNVSSNIFISKGGRDACLV